MATNPRRSATRAKRITCRRIIRLRADPSRPLLEIPLGERCSRQKKAIRDHERSAGARPRGFEAPQRIGGRPCDGTALLNWKRPGGTASPTCPQLPRVSIDGYRTEQPRLMVVVANGQCYAGGMQICPGALMTDGLLDVCLVSDVPRHALIGLLRQVFNGGHVGHPSVKLMRAHHVSIDGPPDCPVHLDGELVGHLPVELEVAQRRLPVLVPRRQS